MEIVKEKMRFNIQGATANMKGEGNLRMKKVVIAGNLMNQLNQVCLVSYGVFSQLAGNSCVQNKIQCYQFKCYCKLFVSKTFRSCFSLLGADNSQHTINKKEILCTENLIFYGVTLSLISYETCALLLIWLHCQALLPIML